MFQDLTADECVICVQVNGTEADYEYEEITLERVRTADYNLTDERSSVDRSLVSPVVLSRFSRRNLDHLCHPNTQFQSVCSF